jgi:acetylornithine deacetylase/succinyl-diaminopimelate desuccinylase-like protein
MNQDQIIDYVEQFWETDIIDSLADYIRIPNKSPMFDKDWEANGYMRDAMVHVMDWVADQKIPGLEMELHQLAGRTPTLLLEYPGEQPGTVLIYGHLDKQPEFNGWHEGLSAWEPVRRDDKLYGRGGADDGYAIYSAIAAIKALREQALTCRSIWRHYRVVSVVPGWSLLLTLLAATTTNCGLRPRCAAC